jgi:hypothetical protein
MFKDELKAIGACEKALEWVGDRSLEEAWAECDRGDWMLWYLSKTGYDKRKLTLVKVKCVRLVQHLLHDERSLKALDVAERYALGEASEEELREAAVAAWDVAEAAWDVAEAAWGATAADKAAVWAARAATAAARAATAAARAAAADAADDAAVWTDAASDSSETLLRCAEICREEIRL